MAEKTIFDWLNDVTLRKVSWHEQPDQKKFSGYMATRWFSMSSDLLDIIADCQPVVSRMDSREVYKFYSDLLPKRKFYAKYIKASSGGDDKLIQFISSKLEIGQRDAIELIETSSRDDLRDFIAGYGFTEKDIKREFSI